MTNEPRRLRELRLDAQALDLTLRKVPERSRWYAQYGPYQLTDPTAGDVVVVGGFADLDEVEAWLTEHAPESQRWRREHGQDKSWQEKLAERTCVHCGVTGEARLEGEGLGLRFVCGNCGKNPSRVDYA